MKEKYDILRFTPNITYSNRNNNNNTYKDLFFGNFNEKSLNNDKKIAKNIVFNINNNDNGKTNDNIKENNIREINTNTEMNNNIQNANAFEKNMNILNNDNNNIKMHITSDNINNSNIKSANNLKKKIFFENLQINKYNHSVKTYKNKKLNEREEIRKRYLIAKKKLEESYFNREKIYYIKKFKNFPFVKYIYSKNKKLNIINEESLCSNINKDLENQKKLNMFLKKLNSGKNALFSKSVIREAGYYSKNNSYNKKNTRNNKNSTISSYCKTDYRNGNNNYDLDVCFLKHIDFQKINNS